MTEPDDHDLLATYARTGDETAFAALVARHINLVHSAARRFAGNDAAAAEITQAVFLILARKAGSLRRGTPLAGWLYQTARLTAANLAKADFRRQQREQEAYMQSQLNEADAAVWRQIGPLLDHAMGKLGATDRAVLVLRFFENQTNAEAAAALGLAEGAVQKHAHRALEKLRKIFAKQGVTHTAEAIAGTVTANAVVAAPAGLALKIAALTAKGAVVSTSLAALVKGTIKVMAWTKAKMVVAVAVGALLAGGTAVVISDIAAPLPRIKALPNPNGYDFLVKAGAMISNNNTLNFNSASREQLRVMTAANAEALALARAGLSNECRVPLQYSQAYIENHMAFDLVGMKKLGQAFITEGKLAELENRTNDAVKSYLDTVHLANESARGGVVIDLLVGTAIEANGTSHLTNLVSSLDSKTCRETATALESLDMQRQSWNEVMQQEHDWSRRTFTGIRYAIMRKLGSKSMDFTYAAAKQKNEKQPKIMRQLIIQFAARAYRLDQGHQPETLDDLVPDYLKTVPLDPITGKNMVYLPE